MSNYEKGSQLWMQMYANNKNLFDELNFNSLITNSFETTTKDFDNKFILKQEDLIWLSPLKLFDYREFELKETDFWMLINTINLLNSTFQIVFPFNRNDISKCWASRGTSPVWDGIALSADRKTLYLFEAKANIDEITSGDKVIPESVQSVIYRKYNELKDKLEFSIDYTKFLNTDICHYQILNRLWFFDMIRYYIKHYGTDSSIDNVQLVFLEFCNDSTHIPTKKDEFHDKYFGKNGIWEDFNRISKTKKESRPSGLELPNEDISVIYLDIDDISKTYLKINPKFDIPTKNKVIQTKFW